MQQIQTTDFSQQIPSTELPRSCKALQGYFLRLLYYIACLIVKYKKHLKINVISLYKANYKLILKLK